MRSWRSALPHGSRTSAEDGGEAPAVKPDGTDERTLTSGQGKNGGPVRQP